MASSSSPLRKDVTGFVVLLALFLTAAFALMSNNQPSKRSVSIEESRDPSIDNTRSSGSRGLFEWTGKLAYKPEAWRKDFLNLPADAQVLFCIAPDSAFDAPDPASSDSSDQAPSKHNLLTSEEGRAVAKWVAQGHTFVLVASSLPNLAETEKSEGGDASADDSATVASGTFGSELGIEVEQSFRNGNRRDYTPLQPSRLTAGVSYISIHPGSVLHRDSDDGEVLFGDSTITPRATPSARASTLPKSMHKAPPIRPIAGVTTTYTVMTAKPDLVNNEPIVLTYPLGKGRVIAISDDVFACNANLCRADNAVFLYRILSTTAKPGATILFDEFHRDYGGENTSMWAAITRPFQLAIVQFLLAAAVALVVLIPRLGRPEPLPDRRQRNTAEYVTSLAGLYQSAGATSTALDTVYRQFLRDLCNRFRVPTDLTLDKLANIVARRGRVNETDLRKLLVSCEQASGSSIRLSERDLISLVRGIEWFRKELGIA